MSRPGEPDHGVVRRACSTLKDTGIVSVCLGTGKHTWGVLEIEVEEKHAGV